MSRIGKVPVKIPSGVKVIIEPDAIKVEGPKGKLTSHMLPGVNIKIEGDILTVSRKDDKDPLSKSTFGTCRTIIFNMVQGVTKGFEKNLEIIGVGYRAAVKGQILNLNLGFSHPIDFKLPEGITAKVQGNTKLKISGADKVIVGEVAAKIRGFRPPEPYQGKGVKYSDERILRKQGKAAGAK